MSTWINKPTTGSGNLKEIKNALYSFFYYMCTRKVTTHLSLTYCDRIASHPVSWISEGPKLMMCLNIHTPTDSPTNNTATLHNHTHTQRQILLFHWIHNHNANQIPPATFSPLHTKFPAIKISRTRTMFYFLTHVVLSPGSLIHPHTLIWEKPTYGLQNLV